MKQVYVDLDGVLADLDAGYYAKWGYTPGPADGPPDPAFWKNIMGDKRFFAELPLMEDAELLVNTVKMLSPTVEFLTACSDTWYDSVRAQKIEWAGKHFPGIPIHTVRRGTDKARYARSKHDILIDDTHANINAWRKAGGSGVLYRSFEDAMPSIRRYFK